MIEQDFAGVNNGKKGDGFITVAIPRFRPKEKTLAFAEKVFTYVSTCFVFSIMPQAPSRTGTEGRKSPDSRMADIPSSNVTQLTSLSPSP